MNREEMFANYHYQRGYLDGRGYGNRGTGKTGRNILDAVMTASETKSDVFFVCDNEMQVDIITDKIAHVAVVIDFNFVKTHNGIAFENGSSVSVFSIKNIRGRTEQVVGIEIANPLIIIDVNPWHLTESEKYFMEEFKYMIQARTR